MCSSAPGCLVLGLYEFEPGLVQSVLNMFARPTWSTSLPLLQAEDSASAMNFDKERRGIPPILLQGETLDFEAPTGNAGLLKPEELLATPGSGQGDQRRPQWIRSPQRIFVTPLQPSVPAEGKSSQRTGDNLKSTFSISLVESHKYPHQVG